MQDIKLILENPYGLQNNCQRVYEFSAKLPELIFRKILIGQKKKIDQYLSKISLKYKIDMTLNSQFEVQEDAEIHRDEWNTYFIYLLYLQSYFDRLFVSSKNFNESDPNPLIEENILFILKLVFRKAVGDSNEIYVAANKQKWFCDSNLLKTIWDWIGMDPVPPFSKFESMEGDKNEKNKSRNVWRSYEINEKCERLLKIKI